MGETIGQRTISSRDPGALAPDGTGQQVSVIVCAYTERRWDRIVAAVRSLQEQTVAPAEVILAVDHNPSLLARAKRALPELVTVASRHDPGLSGARNAGIEAARGEIVAFLDDDAVAVPDWLERILEPYADLRVMGVGGRAESVWEYGRPTWFPGEFEWVVGSAYVGLPEQTAPIRNLHGGNMSLRRATVQSVGGFRTDFGRVGCLPVGCEETELCIRLRQAWPGLELVYAPGARTLHYIPRERGRPRYFAARCYSEGLSKANVARAVGSQAGLATERSYSIRTLPRGFAIGIRDFVVGRQPGGLGRAGAIAAGFTLTAAGYAVGRLRHAF